MKRGSTPKKMGSTESGTTTRKISKPTISPTTTPIRSEFLDSYFRCQRLQNQDIPLPQEETWAEEIPPGFNSEGSLLTEYEESGWGLGLERL